MLCWGRRHGPSGNAKASPNIRGLLFVNLLLAVFMLPHCGSTDSRNERVSRLSSSSNLGLLTHPWDTLGGHNYLVRLYIVEFESLEDDSHYEVIDSILSMSIMMLSDSNAMAFVTRNDTCCALVSVLLPNVMHLDTVFFDCSEDDNAWLWHPYELSFRLSDSLLIFGESHVDKNTMLPISIVARVRNNNILDTLHTIINAWQPRFSSDGTELFFATADKSDSENANSQNIAIYDIEKDSFYVPMVASGYSIWPYRPNREAPLYFLRTYPSSGEANVWKFDDSLGEVQITYYTNPHAVDGFQVTSDSIILKVGERTKEGIETKRVSLKLR